MVTYIKHVTSCTQVAPTNEQINGHPMGSIHGTTIIQNKADSAKYALQSIGISTSAQISQDLKESGEKHSDMKCSPIRRVTIQRTMFWDST
jgi:hypothetical protein